MAAIDPNKRFREYLDQPTLELRQYLQSHVVSENPRELQRLEAYHLYWKFYDGFHYREYNHAMISQNYVRAFIDKVNLFLLGSEGFNFKVVSYYNDIIEEEVSKPLEELIQYNWRRNNKSRTMHEILQMGSVCGDVWVMPTWEQVKKYVKLNILDSRQCFPIFNEGNFDDLVGFQVRQVLNDEKSLGKSKDGYRLKVTYYTKDKVETWYQKTSAILTPDWNQYQNKFRNDVHDYNSQENPLGFIPVVHIKNRPSSNNYFGRSDATDILKLNKVYNELTQELKGIVDYYSTPTTVVTGATIKNMTRGLGNVWSGLPPEANVFTLGLDADLSSMMQLMDKLKTAMHEISDVPENVLGKLQSISGTSAAALQLTFQPLVQQADMKALTYGEGVAEINEMIIRILKIYDKKNKRLSQFEFDEDEGDIRVEPVWKYGFPTDRMNQLQELQYETQLGLVSKRQSMNRLGVANVEDLLQEIEEEKLADAELAAKVNELTTPKIPLADPNEEGGEEGLDNEE